MSSTILKETRKLYGGYNITGKGFGHLFIRILFEKHSYDAAKIFFGQSDIYTLSIIKTCSKVVSKKLLP